MTKASTIEEVASASRIEKFDWQQIATELNEQGSATLKGVLTPDECRDLRACTQMRRDSAAGS
jgi:uncharacterized protein